MFKAIKSKHACFLAILGLLQFTSAAQAIDYYVSPTGVDTNAGTSISSPWKSISKAVQATVPGDTVYLRGGTYHQQADIRSGGGTAASPVVVRPYGSESVTITGADIVTGWTLHGVASDGKNIYKKTGWTVDSQQVFVGDSASSVILNGTPLQQIGVPSGIPASNVAEAYPFPVGSGISDLQAGRFYYDNTAQTLYICLQDGADPNTRGIAASTRRRTLFFQSDVRYVTVQNINFRYSNVTAETNMSPSISLGENCTLKQCNVQWSDCAGIGLAHGAEVQNCVVSNNGQLGIGSAGQMGTLIRNNIIQNNNNRRFNPSWNAGGIKSTSNAYGVIDNNEISHNFGQGVWFDFCRSTSQNHVRNNYIHDNLDTDATPLYVTAGVMVEVSDNVNIYNNVIRKNSLMGIYVSASNNTKIYNNTLAENIGTNHGAVKIAGMPRGGATPPATLKNNTVTNNIFYNNANSYDLIITSDPAPDISGNSADYNLYYRAGGGFISNKCTPTTQSASYSLAHWRTNTGWDMHGIQADPLFFSGSGSAFGIPTNSPAKGAGNAAVNLLYDFTGAPRPAGTNDIGAYQAAASIANGTYMLTPDNATTTRMDATGMGGAGTQLQIWGANNQANQKWIFTNLGNGYYKIQPSYVTGLAVDVPGGQDVDGTIIALSAENGNGAQQWRLTANSNGTYRLSPRCAPKRSLEVSGGATANGTKCIINLTHGSAAQNWHLTSVS